MLEKALKNGTFRVFFTFVSFPVFNYILWHIAKFVLYIDIYSRL